MNIVPLASRWELFLTFKDTGTGIVELQLELNTGIEWLKLLIDRN
jgi:hypothetical protein